jgi:hypothetical protein
MRSGLVIFFALRGTEPFNPSPAPRDNKPQPTGRKLKLRGTNDDR